MKNTKAKPAATVAAPKRTINSAILLHEEGTGRILADYPFTVVPDDSHIPDDVSFTFTRTQYAEMIRSYRNDPATPRRHRNHPTPSKITVRVITLALSGKLKVKKRKKEVAA